ncbi:NADH dehydrogenase [ubiquinone] 1 alpha subcomplex assembly factor 2 [Parasteatoda tepidariorum]|uniref:Mimitin, mitochondrial n=1 Tax=Parasteatoda tepidariorum TaxID=114398 RepID=A0A2L2YJI9_PARTP|nr:NADH dehydrogenase [ubiquinone] 1 alpha subcomplex assembly factor 2 [Parasteatoda tepidariorum]XP_015926072.1 NADH dehydrogenase [ubiquinone] 1 alpha subcomplex assembly factor 2 [Parasteatoda tepidariorum]XP_015926073.1 NADH dehydrogenase [ubiquinone] 1 alpha subcomplex assembly factor 2 [Parasteatoda tepidariorum]XP_015926074.1 NADH dehydrogenase [ubiquinone] 1 alpha subcomplex assembly factor 2 [Parasteatoda tepidariorum]XP_015926075.1 NADH dehydrogenase [ubiquinone] 1 alpha subcomplex a
MSEGRSVWRMIINNIIRSFKVIPSEGKLMGEDNVGNKYYEASRRKESFKKLDTRWFEPKDGEWQQDLPAEWEAWLRGRRKDPPTKEEIQMNLAVANMKKENAKKNAGDKELDSKPSVYSSEGGFPRRNDYEREPGKQDQPR